MVALETASGRSKTFEDRDWIFGEPVFVPEPGAAAENAGVLLAVGSHRTGKRSAMLVVDAESMQLRAQATIEHELPMGFHGSFIHPRG
jgi:carotenoid cleavage dioxygenase-like enzyme